MSEREDTTTLATPRYAALYEHAAYAGPQSNGSLAPRLPSPPHRRQVLLVSDVAMLLSALGLTYLLRPVADMSPLEASSAWLYTAAAVLALIWRDTYRERLGVSFVDGIGSVVLALALVALTLIMAFALLLPSGIATVTTLISKELLLSVALVGGGRFVVTGVQSRVRRRRRSSSPAAIVGAGVVGHRIARRLELQPELGLRPVGFIDDSPAMTNGLPLLGRPDDVERLVREHDLRHMILAFTRAADESLLPFVRRCSELGVEVSVVPRLFDTISSRARVRRLGGIPLLDLSRPDPNGWQFGVKYALDRVLAMGLLLAVAPLLVALALAVKASSPGPVLFRQRRVGRDGQPFDMLKFRSMRGAPENDAPFRLQPDEAPGGVEGADRRTRVGRFLRRTSLDELPQLFNVLKGQMSLVGPRPERPELVELFDGDVQRYGERHRVKAGITGWAQVYGLRGRTSLADRVEWDNYYIDNWSLGLDAKILVMTIFASYQRVEE